MMMLAYKHLALQEAELKVVDPESGKSDPFSITGYGSTFGGKPDAYGDVIAPGAYTETLKHWMSGKSGSLQIYWNHNPDAVIGKWVGLSEDKRGLLAQGELAPGNTLASDIAALVKHGSVSGLSIGYRPKKITKLAGGINQLDEIELRELSIVSRPANNHARITAMKSVADLVTDREFEAFLRENCGLSRTEATALCDGGLKALRRSRDETDRGEATDEPRDEDKAALSMELLAGLRGLRPRDCQRA